MRNVILISIVLVSFSLSSAYAEITISEYNERQRDTVDWKLVELYIEGVGDALSRANDELRNRAQQPLYCQPERLPMTKEGYVAILDNYLKKPDAKERAKRVTESQPEKASVGMFLMYALSDTFPCGNVTTPPPQKAGSR